MFWNTVDLQCHVNFCCTAKWFNHTHLRILFHILFCYGLLKDIIYSSLCYIVATRLFRCNSYSHSLVAPKMSFPVSVSKPKSTLSLFEIRRVFFFPYWPFIFHHINFCLVDYSSLWTYQTAFLWYDFSSVQSLSHVWLFATPWFAAHQANLSITNSRSLFKLMSIESVMPSKHLILCHSLLLPPSIFPSIRIFSDESVFHIRWSKYWSFSISPSNEHLGLIFFRMDWLSLDGSYFFNPFSHYISLDNRI